MYADNSGNDAVRARVDMKPVREDEHRYQPTIRSRLRFYTLHRDAATKFECEWPRPKLSVYWKPK